MSLTLTEIAEIHGIDDLEEMFERDVRDAAAVLDEHVPCWNERITRPINMDCIDCCVLGQVFHENPDDDCSGSGYYRGLKFLAGKGITTPPFVFTTTEVTRYWNAEIAKRTELVAV